MTTTYRSPCRVTYHGRTGYPTIHVGPRGGEYIMVRKLGGGTKRMYIDKTKYNMGLPAGRRRRKRRR